MSEVKTTISNRQNEQVVRKVAKSGVRTSEFWVTGIVAMAGFLVWTGVITTEQLDQATPLIREIGGAMAAIVTAAYTISRAITKR
jgi:hypothetical protein